MAHSSERVNGFPFEVAAGKRLRISEKSGWGTHRKEKRKNCLLYIGCGLTSLLPPWLRARAQSTTGREYAGIRHTKEGGLVASNDDARRLRWDRR